LAGDLPKQISDGMGGSLPFACQDWASAKAADRFFANCFDRMTLRTTLTSPYGRKVRIAAHALGLDGAIAIEPADTLDETDTQRIQNPLGKMPCPLLGGGMAVYDSRVILEFLDTLGGGHMLIPRDGLDRYRTLTLATLCDRIADAGLLMVYEGRFREPAQISQRWLSHQRGKVVRALSAIERNPPDPARTDIVSISLACALGYLDWRKPVDWRASHGGLAGWLDAFAAHQPAFPATRPPAEISQ
jgi:glutathione S-transferase